MRGYVKAAGIAKSGACHVFRHTAATLMLDGGADIRVVQEILGHADFSTTQIYTHVSIRRLKEVHARAHPAEALPDASSSSLHRQLDRSCPHEHIDPMDVPDLRPVDWIGPTRRELRRFPETVREAIGFALFRAQLGAKHSSAKPLKGFGGAGVLEIVEDHDGDAYRAVYTVRFAEAVYVLHVFQKKSKKKIATPRHELDVIRARLKDAERRHEESLRGGRI
jgi:phage-related protein